MIKLKFKDMSIITPLIKERIAESNLGDRLTVDACEKLVALNVINGSSVAFVDRTESPRSLLVITSGRTSFLTEECCIINILHVASEVRKDARLSLHLSREMFDTAMAHAASIKADAVRASSWVFRGGMDITPILESEGFEPQSHEFIKLLKK